MVIVKTMTKILPEDNQCLALQLPRADLDRVLANAKMLRTAATETYALSNGKVCGDDCIEFDIKLSLA